MPVDLQIGRARMAIAEEKVSLALRSESPPDIINALWEQYQIAVLAEDRDALVASLIINLAVARRRGRAA